MSGSRNPPPQAPLARPEAGRQVSQRGRPSARGVVPIHLVERVRWLEHISGKSLSIVYTRFSGCHAIYTAHTLFAATLAT